jgi:dTDP-4-dehydrorhamnose 3,5-epimerase
VEWFRHDELPAEHHPLMAYISETLPGVARGPHEHAHQDDFFAFVGPGEFTVYLWDARPDSPTRGRRMKFLAGAEHKLCVRVPPGVVHAYKNTGTVPGLVLNAPNRLFKGAGRQEPVDEVRHENRPDNPYLLD